jgi:quinoprotein glucose dehydrogenase
MPRFLQLICAGTLVCLLGVGVCGDLSGQSTESDWAYFGGDKAFTRYAPLDQITRDNVDDLRILWRRPAVDAALMESFPRLNVSDNLRATPILIDGVLYAPNGVGLVEAFHPATGETLWVQEPYAPTMEEASGRSSRGLDYWGEGAEGRLIAVRGSYLYALDPQDGRVLPDFGEGGRVNLVPPSAQRFNWSSGPIVVNDVIVIGGTLDGAGDSGMSWRGSAAEDVRGFDVRSGRLLWTFHVVPREGEFGADTWGNESGRESGDLGSWCCLSADEELGYVYVPLTAPTAAYYGGHRPGDNLFSNSLVALDAATGERVWHFQMVHHDLWEYDTVGPPTLGEIVVDGRRIRAVMQPSKTGFLYVFDRATGEPVWPIEERPVPQSTVPGEYTSPTQPFPTKPAPFARHGLTVDDFIDFPEVRDRALAIADSFVIGPIFTPPSVVSDEPGGKKGTLMVPGSWGSGNWNTGAFDPETGLYYAYSHTVPRVYRLVEATDPDSEMAYWSPEREAPYVDGLPLPKPPWGRITAIDMNSGEHAWMVANGAGLQDHPALEDLDVPDLGVASRPVALVTRTLLLMGEGGDVFGGIQANMWGRSFRAYDKATGEVLWETDLPAGVTGGPMTYMFEGKQYVVVPIGGADSPPEWVALGLP